MSIATIPDVPLLGEWTAAQADVGDDSTQRAITDAFFQTVADRFATGELHPGMGAREAVAALDRYLRDALAEVARQRDAADETPAPHPAMPLHPGAPYTYPELPAAYRDASTPLPGTPYGYPEPMHANCPPGCRLR